jgi:hypothetical protein
MKEEANIIATNGTLILIQYVKAFVIFSLSGFPAAFGSILAVSYPFFSLPFAALTFYMLYLSLQKLLLALKAESLMKHNIKKVILSKKIAIAKAHVKKLNN